MLVLQTNHASRTNVLTISSLVVGRHAFTVCAIRLVFPRTPHTNITWEFSVKSGPKPFLNLGNKSSRNKQRNTFCLIFRTTRHFDESSVSKLNSDVTTMKI